jgi:hypothetical protein
VRRCLNSLVLADTSWEYDRPIAAIAASTVFDYGLGVIAPVVIFLAADAADTFSL